MVRFGVAGYPPAFNKMPYRRERLQILNWLAGLGLDALELQMTYGPRTAVERCREYRKMAADFGITLSVHASYFIVFTSRDPEKLARSQDTLKRTFDLCGELGADVAVLHPGPLYGEDPTIVLDRFIENLGRCIVDLGQSETGLFVETAGKVGQLGSVEEILRICNAIPGVFPCIDFGHIHARTLGTLDTDKAIGTLFRMLGSHGQGRSPSRMHFHYTPIHYGPRGEISHKAIHDRYQPEAQMTLACLDEDPLLASNGYYHPRFEPIGRGLRTIGLDCTVISETHDSQEEGALALKGAFLAGE